MKPSLPLLLCLSLACCSNSEDPSQPSLSQAEKDRWVEGVLNEQILTATMRFEEKADELYDMSQELCHDPSEQHLVTTRSAFRDSATEWYRLQLFHFGPAVQDAVFPLYTFVDALRLRGTDYRTTVSTTQAKWRASDEPLDADFFAEQRFQYVGLLALETALFENDTTPESLASQPRRCAILQGLARRLQSEALTLRRGWTDPGSDDEPAFAEHVLLGTLPDGTPSISQLFISAAEYATYLHQRNVHNLAGQVAGVSWDLMRAALTSLRQLLTKRKGHPNLFELLSTVDEQALVEIIEAHLDQAQAAISDEDPEAWEAALRSLSADFEQRIPDALGLDLGVTFNDGD